MKQTIAQKLGKRLKILRQRYNWTQAEIAERAEITNTYYSEIECGKRNISLENIYAIAKGFKINISQLFDDKYLPDLPKKTMKTLKKTRKNMN
jgi:transcriptional regulator with XRE-family HTH domain